MNSSELLHAEAAALARPAVLLVEQGEGEPAAYWLADPTDGEPCIAFRHAQAWHVLVPDAKGGGACVPLGDPALLSCGVPLYAREHVSLPPVDALFLFGSERIADYLARHDWTREDGFNDNFPDPAAHTYERQWQATCPLYMSEVVAMLGGWNFPWPDGDFAECAGDVLVLWTLRGSEPWLEVFVHDSAWRVVERRS